MENIEMIAFDPVPSRCLGKNVGINNIPTKNRSYSYIYCQVGKNIRLNWKEAISMDQKTFFER